MTISDLMSTQALITQQGIRDTAALQPLVSPTGNNNITSAFMSWAAAGFPSKYIVLDIKFSTLWMEIRQSRPNTYEYATQLLGVDLSQAVANFGSNFQGMKFSYMTLPNSIEVMVSKDDASSTSTSRQS